MNPEQYKNRSSEKIRLTRRQKLLHRAVPLVLIAAGAGGAFAHSALANEEKEVKPEIKGEAVAQTSASIQFEGSDSGWGHGTAERLIIESVHTGATHAFALLGEAAPKFDEGELEEIIEELPVYDEANEALDMAGYNEILPDEGDTLSINVEVTANTDKEVRYVVKHAEIQDLPNNQK